VNFFQYDNLGQQNGVFSGIVDYTLEVGYSLLNRIKVGSGPELSGVGISSQYIRDLLNFNTVNGRFHTRQ